MRRSSLLVVFAVAAVVGNAVPAAATHAWENYHWRRSSNPLTVKLGDNLSTKWDKHLSKASYDWTKSVVLNTKIVAGQTTPSKCYPTSGRVEVCNSKYGANGWLGLATVWLSGSHITKGTVKLNDTYFNRTKYNDPNARQHVMCQEVGHIFGLEHQRKVGSKTCMDDVNGLFSSAYIHPNQHDYDQLKTIYKHLDSSSGSGGGSTGKVIIHPTGPESAIVSFIFWAPTSTRHDLASAR